MSLGSILKTVGIVAVVTGVSAYFILHKLNINNEKVLGVQASNIIPGLSVEKQTGKSTVNSVSSFLDSALTTTEKLGEDLVREGGQFVYAAASKSAETVTNTVIKSTTDVLIGQIDKLPDNQKEEIKNNICGKK